LYATGEFPTGQNVFLKYWAERFATGSVLAKFAVMVGTATVTEAAVERSFSAEVFGFFIRTVN
jgi:hypothetical protein